MDSDDIYQNVERRDIVDTTGPQTLNHSKDEGKDQKCRGSRCLVWMTVCLGIICVLLLVFIILQHISNTAERESLFKSNKNTAEEFNQTINSLQHNYTELMTEKDRLKNNFNSLSQKKLDGLLISNKDMSWSDSRQYCRDRGGDLVIIDTEEKQKLISSLFKERLWIGLTDIEKEGNMKWMDNSPLKQRFWREGEPNDANGKEDCVEIVSFCAPSKLKNWNDLPCSEKRKCICEK